VPGRLPLFLDACVRGSVVEGLRRRGWDLVRAVDIDGEGVKDPQLFDHAASLSRVFVTNDGPLHRVALEWVRAARPFRMIYWSKNDDQRYSVGQILGAFDELAAQVDDPFRYPIYYLKPRS
jgi:hypothetical protein